MKDNGTDFKCVSCSGDLKGAVEEAKRIHERHRCLPLRLELLIHLINSYHDAGSDRCVGPQQTLVTQTLLLYHSLKAMHDRNGVQTGNQTLQ